MLEVNGGKLMVPDSMGAGSCLVGWKGAKPGNGGYVFCNYIPVVENLTPEEREARRRKERAGRKYATVKLSNSNPSHRGKRGEIVGIKHIHEIGRVAYCLNIDTLNTCSTDGCHTLIGVPKSQYKNIWFTDDQVENFEQYDGNGDPTDYCEEGDVQ